MCSAYRMCLRDWGDSSGGKETPLASAQGGFLPPEPPILPPTRFIQKDTARRERRRFPPATVSRNDVGGIWHEKTLPSRQASFTCRTDSPCRRKQLLKKRHGRAALPVASTFPSERGKRRQCQVAKNPRSSAKGQAVWFETQSISN